jgi:hypothetical protein
MAAKMAMIAITTSSSINVKPLYEGTPPKDRFPFFGDLILQRFIKGFITFVSLRESRQGQASGIFRRPVSSLEPCAAVVRPGNDWTNDSTSSMRLTGLPTVCKLSLMRGKTRNQFTLHQLASTTSNSEKKFVLLALAFILYASANSQESSVGQSRSSRQNSTETELVSGQNRLRIDPVTGRIGLISAGERTLLDGARGRGPFRLHVPIPDFEAHMVEGHHTRPKIETSGGTVRMNYAHLLGKHGSVNIEAEVTIRSAQDGGFELSCRLHNGTQTKIPQVFFPSISGFGKIDGDADQVTFGHSTFKPWQTWHTPPDHLFMQYRGHPTFEMLPGDGYKAGIKWMDWSGVAAGASLFSKQREPVTQFMLVSSDGYGRDTIDLAWYFYPFIAPRADWQSPTFVLYPHKGDWHHGILKFKEFADQTFHPAPSTPARDETLGQQCLWLGWAYQDWQDTPLKFKDIPAVAEEARRAGFRELSLWGTFNYFRLPHSILAPLGNDEEFKKAVEGCRALGVNAVPIIS